MRRRYRQMAKNHKLITRLALLFKRPPADLAQRVDHLSAHIAAMQRELKGKTPHEI